MRTRTDASHDPDRAVHATSPDGLSEVARYDRSGRYRIEVWHPDGAPASSGPLTLPVAVETARRWARNGGKVHLGRAGGRRFDATYRRTAGVS